MDHQYYYYKAFGLIFQSCLKHPEFEAISGVVQPDCFISFGQVPPKLTKPDLTGGVYQVKGGQFLLKIEHVGRYLVENGTHITIDRLPGATIRETIVFLWASAIAALLHQRGIVIVHGSAIKLCGQAVIFSGPSGSGKSTIASTFIERAGAQILSDDISAIAINPAGTAVVLPGYPYMKLWRDSADKLGFEWDSTRLIRESVNKMVVNISDRFADQETPLSQFYLLSYKNAGSAEIEEVNGYKKMELMLGKIFRKNYLKRNETGPVDIFAAASRILPQVRLCTLQRQYGIDFLDETIGSIQNDLQELKIS